MKLNKSDLTDLIASNMGTSKAKAEKALEVVLECLRLPLIHGDTVALKGFGKFDTRTTKARTQRIGDRVVDVPARTVVRFKPSKTLLVG